MYPDTLHLAPIFTHPPINTPSLFVKKNEVFGEEKKKSEKILKNP